MGQSVLIYDDRCYFCSISARFLKRMDVLHAIKMQPSSTAEPISFNLSAEKIDNAVWVIVFKTGKKLNGIKAISYCALISPPIFPLFLFIQLIRLTGKGDVIYNKIALNRYLVSRMIENRINR